MSGIFRETHHITQLFFSVGGIGRVDSLGVNFVPERKTKDDADADGITGDTLEGNIPVKGWAGQVIHDEHNVAQYEKPAGGITPCAVHNVIGDAFNVLPISFSRILVLVLWFALPIPNAEVIKDDVYTFAHFIGGRVRDEVIRSTAGSDILLENVGEMGFGFQAINITNVGGTSEEDLCTGTTIIHPMR
jgi:hypothetical protein